MPTDYILEKLGLSCLGGCTEEIPPDQQVGVQKLVTQNNWLLYGGAPDNFGYNNTDISMYPSSNDTHLMVTKPMLVNLGSKSSKCTEIKTPMDPAKMRFIDNKRMSIIIGCTAGILVFIFIIIR